MFFFFATLVFFAPTFFESANQRLFMFLFLLALITVTLPSLTFQLLIYAPSYLIQNYAASLLHFIVNLLL